MMFLFSFALIRGHFERHDQFLLGFRVLIRLLLLLLLFDKLVLDQTLDLVWVVFGDICDTFTTGSDEALEGEVVARGQRVVLVCLDVASGVLSGAFVELVFVEHDLELLEVYWDRVLTNYDAGIIFNALALFEPDVCSNVGSSEPFCWISVQNLCDKVAAVLAYEIWDAVVSIENLFVKHICFGVFKRQVTADHRVENNTAGPDICWQAMIMFAGDHLWRSIARATACSFQSLTWSIRI